MQEKSADCKKNGRNNATEWNDRHQMPGEWTEIILSKPDTSQRDERRIPIRWSCRYIGNLPNDGQYR